MKHECSYVRDVLALYVEEMLSEETARFVKDHLDTCPACRGEWEAMKAGGTAGADTAQRRDDAGALVGLKKKLRKRKLIAAAVTAACVVAAVVLLHLFPVYRLAQVGGTSYYSAGEIAGLAYIGSGADRAQAQAVLRLADAAFHDCRHTDEENEALYGLLSRYATDLERGASYTNHSLELWSAHLGENEGYLWVYYSVEAVDAAGNTVCGSWNIPALWTVEKDDTGTWVVTHIKEHP